MTAIDVVLWLLLAAHVVTQWRINLLWKRIKQFEKREQADTPCSS